MAAATATQTTAGNVSTPIHLITIAPEEAAMGRTTPASFRLSVLTSTTWIETAMAPPATRERLMITRLIILLLTLGLLVTATGCGSDDSGNAAADRAAERRADAREQARERVQRQQERRREQLQKLKRQQAQAEAKALAAPAPAPEPEPEAEQAGSGCDPNYSGACLDPNSPDYDCEGGSGDGPDYVGIVQVVGSDVYDLDADGDGTACDT